MRIDGTALLWGWLLAGGIMLILWLRQLRTGNVNSVDVAWTANLGLLALLYAVLADGTPLHRRLLVAGAAILWSGRLALHLYLSRVRSGEPEDPRYHRLRRGWGSRAGLGFFFVYQAQALLDVILSVPFLLALSSTAPGIGAWEAAGLALLAAGVAGEAVADRQLAAHRADPASRGRTCRAGLWRYSRHPNYFFEWLCWCAFALMALPAPGGAAALAAPALMLFLVTRVTGIPPTEAQALRSRGDDYREYQATTSPFFPWPPRQVTRRPNRAGALP